MAMDTSVLTEKPAPPPSALTSTVDPDLDDLYTRFKRLEQQLEFLEVQEEYIKDEQRNLKKEYLHAQEEVNYME